MLVGIFYICESPVSEPGQLIAAHVIRSELFNVKGGS